MTVGSQQGSNERRKGKELRMQRAEAGASKPWGTGMEPGVPGGGGGTTGVWAWLAGLLP